MIQGAYLDRASVQQLFNTATGHVPHALENLERSRLLWLNRRVMRRDPQFTASMTEHDYAQHLLRSCARGSLAPDEAIADRYGGSGIGRNGGSGRAAFVNGYHVKGVGRTALVSALTDEAHASGGAYLEEVVREAIFSELVDSEFPHGAVPVLAIIDTGQVQIWQTEKGPKPERRCLLVRPGFIRPAHFMRAAEYISSNPKEGALDATRVALTCHAALRVLGDDRLTEGWQQFWLRWAEQLAYGYVHRLNHGAHTESNIALDGRLLDFGAMTALPSWARIGVIQGGPPAGRDMSFLKQAMQAAAPLFARHVSSGIASPERMQRLLLLAQRAYAQTLMRELLRVAGLTRSEALRLLQSPLAQRTSVAMNRLVCHFAREQFHILGGMPTPRVSWDVGQLWCDSPPVHLRELREVLRAAMQSGQLGSQPAAEMERTADARCSLRTTTRDGLFIDRFKETLYADLEGRFAGKQIERDDVGRLIDSTVLEHRRDSILEPECALPIGFASRGGESLALFECQRDGRPFAMVEGQASVDAAPKRLAVAELRNGWVEFTDTALAPARARLFAGSSCKTCR